MSNLLIVHIAVTLNIYLNSLKALEILKFTEGFRSMESGLSKKVNFVSSNNPSQSALGLNLRNQVMWDFRGELKN